MVLFTLYLTYDDEILPRKVADGCNKQQLLEILSRHLMLARVAYFQVVPFVGYVPFEEYTL